MSYPPPSAEEYAVSGYKFFRLNTPLVSDGDIYEASVGAQAFAIGPDSDISKVNVGYFDDQVPRFMNKVALSQKRSFTGRLDARNNSYYAPSNRPGRLLIWPDELYNVDYRPPGWSSGENWRVDLIPPVLDVIQYFSIPAAIEHVRNDRVYRFQQLPLNGTGRYYLVIPFYGRRYASIQFANHTDRNIEFEVYGAYFPYSHGSILAPSDESVLISSQQVNSSNRTTVLVRSELDGYFDALSFGFLYTPGINAGPTPLVITLSDNE